MELKNSNSNPLSSLPFLAKTIIFVFLGPRKLLSLSTVSKSIKRDIEAHISDFFQRTLKICDPPSLREMWEAVFRFVSKKPKVVFALLFWAIGIEAY